MGRIHWTAERIERRVACVRAGLPNGDATMLTKYKRTAVDYLRVLDEQGGGCGVCGRTDNHGFAFAWDHDHRCCPGQKTCGECVAGLLCSQCNTALASLEAGHTENLLAYLARHRS